jgi:hypothetical protein
MSKKRSSNKIFFHSPHFFSSFYLHYLLLCFPFALLASAAKLKRIGNCFLVGGPFWSGGRSPSGGRPGARASWAPLNPALPRVTICQGDKLPTPPDKFVCTPDILYCSKISINLRNAGRCFDPAKHFSPFLLHVNPTVGLWLDYFVYCYTLMRVC